MDAFRWHFQVSSKWIVVCHINLPLWFTQFTVYYAFIVWIKRSVPHIIQLNLLTITQILNPVLFLLSIISYICSLCCHRCWYSFYFSLPYFLCLYPPCFEWFRFTVFSSYESHLLEYYLFRYDLYQMSETGDNLVTTISHQHDIQK